MNGGTTPLMVRQAVEFMRNYERWDDIAWHGSTLTESARLELDLVALHNSSADDKYRWRKAIAKDYGITGQVLGKELARVAREYGLVGKAGKTGDDPIAALVDNLIEQDLPKHQLSTKIAAIASEYGIYSRELEKIYNDRLEARERFELRADTSSEVDLLLKANQGALDLKQVIHPNLAGAIIQLAQSQRVRPETFVTVLMGVASSLIKPETSLCVNEGLDWNDLSANFFGVVVAESSQRKSPIFKAIASAPLKELEKQARESHQKALSEYQELLADYESLSPPERREKFPEGKPKEPKRRIFSFSNATAEGLRNQLSAIPDRGILWSTDELAGMFKSQNAYRGGKGADAEEMLTAYDGSYGKVLRADGLAADLDRISLGIVGTVQPRVLEKLIGSDDDDVSGKWSRFAFVHQPLSAIDKWSKGKVSLTPLLSAVYSQIDSFPAKQYRLSPEADRYFGSAFLNLEKRRVNDPRPGMRSVWGKSEGRIAKLALILHHINAAMEGQSEPSNEIGIDSVKGAVKLTKFYAEQIEALYSSIGSGEGLASHLVKVLELSDRKGWLKAGDVARAIPAKNRPSATEVREWFRELEGMNKGSTRGEGRSLEFNSVDPKIDKIDKTVDKSSISESLTVQGIPPENRQIDKIDNFSNFSTRTPEPTSQGIHNQDSTSLTDGKKESTLEKLSICLQTPENPCCEGDTKIDNLSTNLSIIDSPSTNESEIDDSPERKEWLSRFVEDDSPSQEIDNQSTNLSIVAPSSTECKSGDKVLIIDPRSSKCGEVATLGSKRLGMDAWWVKFTDGTSTLLSPRQFESTLDF
ncbi:YfjI family protein [Laspinema sp. D1]|uniref:YfjI family protein n=1 Tax=Laspinema palackyanum D2a TaxID=2953684 RepID=A0ABT2N045_9CYAN|nr:YfjI family protein [Laspinema sp. D2a]